MGTLKKLGARQRWLMLVAPTLAFSSSITLAQIPNEYMLQGNDDLSRYLLQQQPSDLTTTPTTTTTSATAQPVPEDRWALPIAKDAYGDSATKILYLDQGWSPSQSMQYYFTDQGSQLIAYDLFIHIEQATSTGLFIDPVYLASFRYLPQKASPENPDALPVGFLKRATPHHDYLSLTCSACHTSQINYQGVGIRIDGAGAQADFVGFLAALHQALSSNLEQADKFSRLTQRLFGPQPTHEQIAALRQQLKDNLAHLTDYAATNQSPLRDGFARVDAIGRIYNQVLKAVHAESYLVPDAPVSYPFLWDASHHDYVQWLGLTPNAGPGALGRNAGEVIGVFGDIKVKHQSTKLEKLTGYESSVQTANLVGYEQWLWDLQSPQWPQDILPKIDQGMAAEGRKLYLNNCVACHRDIKRDDPKRLVYAQMYELAVVGTDPKEIHNALRSGNTGLLQGALTGIATDDKYGRTAPVALLLSDLVSGVLLKQPITSIKASEQAKQWGLGLLAPVKQGQYPSVAGNTDASLAAYKARPLNGIWATAPYLHNGSVPTLYHLLLPASQRPPVFAVGQLEFDPAHVGYKHNPTDPLAPYLFDTHLPGNSNQGHEFATHLTEVQRQQLLEYLKTL